MFKDTPEGTTHSFEDGCQPPHEKPLEPVEDDFVEGAIKSLARDTHGLQLWVKNPYKTEAYLLHPNFFREFFTDLLHRHEAHVLQKWEREIVEKCQNVYRPYSELHDPKSNTCPCCVFDEAIEDIISLITKKDV